MAGIRALARWRTLNFNTQRAIWFSQLRLLRPHGLLELHRKVLGESLARGSPLSSSRFAALAPFYTRRAQWAIRVIGGLTRPVTRSLLLGFLVNLAPRPTLPPSSEAHPSELQSLIRI